MDQDLSWREQKIAAAWFFNGEGCTGLYNSRVGSPRRLARVPRIMISQKDPRVLEQFLAFVGGFGRIYHRPARNGHNEISDYVLGNHEKVQAVIAMLWNWLSEQKREQARRVLTDLKVFQRSRRNRAKYRTTCPHGHAYSEENTERRTDKYGTRRHCLACRRERYATMRADPRAYEKFLADHRKYYRERKTRSLVSALLEAV